MSEAKEVKRYWVVNGKAVVTKAGVKTAGQEILPKHVAGGLNRLSSLKAKGYLTNGPATNS